MSSRLAVRWRCWSSWPLGHAYESVRFFDEVAGGWAAVLRCVVCGRSRRVRIGSRPVVAQTSPLLVLAMNVPTATAWVPVRRGSPAVAAAAGDGVPARGEDGERLEIRRVRIVAGAHAGETLYAVRREGSDGAAVVGADLGVAIASAAGVPRDATWVTALARELEDELSAG